MKKTALYIAALTGLLAIACGNVVSDAIAAGDRDFGSGNFEGAISAYSRAVEVVPEVAELSYNVGNAHFKFMGIRRGRGKAVGGNRQR